ncbi:MAG: hypothetical protein ABL921_22240 [Pirellula sp.]
METILLRRSFGLTCGTVLAASAGSLLAQDPPATPQPTGPLEMPFERDYDAPKFKPSWKKQQINRTMAQDFVIYAHSDLEMVRKLLEREPGLLNASIDWGGGDWETALGGASHMGRRDIVDLLLAKGARFDHFCAAMLGQLEAIKSFLALQPTLIDAKGPHGFSLHFHAQVGGDAAKTTLDYLQSIKQIELKPVPFLQKKEPTETKATPESNPK